MIQRLYLWYLNRRRAALCKRYDALCAQHRGQTNEGRYMLARLEATIWHIRCLRFGNGGR